jgi:phosphodiesterase/alkaline phosphatase D-like protein
MGIMLFRCILTIFLITSCLNVMGQSPPPTATTGAASGVNSTNATLNGTVNANGSATTVTFEFGVDTSYGSTRLADQNPVTGSTDTAVSTVVYELLPNTTYHFRVVAQNAGGTSYGTDITFTTLPAPPSVLTTAASGIGTSSATLNGVVNAEGGSATVTFEYGTDSNYGTTVTADQSPVTGTSDTAVSKTITGLAGNTTYHYRVAAANAGGTTFGADRTFTTGTAAPAATTNAASAVGMTSATLNGAVNANNDSTTVTFEYGPSTNYGRTVTASQSPVTGSTDTAVSETVFALAPNTTYHYRVVAVNSNGTTYGGDMTFTTNGAAPTATTNAATNISSTGATLNGTVNAKNDSTTVTFQYGLDPNYGTTVTADQSPVTGSNNTAVSKAIAGLANNTTYHYRVAAVNSFGTTYGADMTFNTGSTAPAATTNTASAVGITSATLNGTVNANNDSTTVTFEYGADTNYGRTITASQSPVTGSSDTAVSETVFDLTPKTTYHYRVVAVNSSGTAYGADMTFTTTGSAPTAATYAATNVSSTGATLNGTVNAKYDSTTVTFQYGLDTNYGSTVTADQSPVTGIGNKAVSAVITGLTSNATYHFRVKAENSIGTTYGSDMTFFTTSTGPTATTLAASNIGPTSATLNGLVNANNNSTTVTFQIGTNTNYGRTVTASQSPASGSTDTAVSINVTGLVSNTTYHFRVVAENSSGTAYGVDMTFLTGFSGLPSVTTAPVTKITFSTAKSGGNVTDEGAASVTARGVCWSTSPNPTIADNFTINDYGPGPFNSTMNQLTPKTTYYVRAYATNSYGTAYGQEFQFTTNSKNVSVKIVQPLDGEEVSGTVTIKVNAKGTAGSQSIAKVEVYIDGTKIAKLTKVPFKTLWNTTTYIDGSHTITAVAFNKDNESSQVSITVTVNNVSSKKPKLSTNRNRLNFNAVRRGKNGHLVTGAQTLLVDNSGGGTLNWSISTDADWVSVSPDRGTGSRMVKVSVDPPKDMPLGSYSGSIRITGPNSANGMVTVDVRLTNYEKDTTAPPFGSFETPVEGTPVAGNISISGWVLDDIEVTDMTIYRVSDGKKGSSLEAIGDAALVDGARPDIERNYPGYPLNYQAGWGYLLMTNLLPNQGNGTFTLVVQAADKEGNTVTLGKKTFTVANASTAEPFGTIDTPGPGGIAAGSNFVNFGWALTPQPNTIPFDGSTIIVWVDGVPLGNPGYNRYRKDVASQFPGYNNSSGAGGYFYLDTTTYTNGIHTIAWSVKDDAGNMAGIGSRYFTILNSDTSSGISSVSAYTPIFHDESSEDLQDEIDTPEIKVEELQQVEFQVSNHFSNIRGYLSVEGKYRPLPIGSTLDARTGRFYWGPGAGFVGTYKLVFVIETLDGNIDQKTIDVTIEPKLNKID